MYLFIFLYLPLLLWSFGIFASKKVHLNMGDGTYLDELNYGVSKFIIFIFSLVFLFIILISNFSAVSSQKELFEQVKKLEKQKQILEMRYNDMSVQLGSVLVEKYPDMEKEIFNSINKENTLFFVKYPELRSSETMINYSNKILELKDDIYNMEIEIEEKIKIISYRRINPWLFSFVIP